MEVNRIYQEDCLKFMDTIPDESVDLVVTSPPYNFGGFSRNGRKSSYDTYEDNLPDEEYKDWIKNILTACNRILKIGGGFTGITKGSLSTMLTNTLIG